MADGGPGTEKFDPEITRANPERAQERSLSRRPLAIIAFVASTVAHHLCVRIDGQIALPCSTATLKFLHLQTLHGAALRFKRPSTPGIVRKYPQRTLLFPPPLRRPFFFLSRFTEGSSAFFDRPRESATTISPFFRSLRRAEPGDGLSLGDDQVGSLDPFFLAMSHHPTGAV